ncbi:hypothetical protein B0H34DRAFT_327837 [Crassisporium funariophilum]|nr:hypothetical protein B0H34DRAFT_327837 [Crassisporium funariophilum]
MFEEICLLCGKRLQDDGRAYCSDDCQNNDVSSPSISSSSSAISSPNMGYAYGGEVPPLMPSALGSALKSYVGRSGYYVSSSSASSTSWSVLTDEEDEGGAHACGGECAYHDPSEPMCDGSSKSANFIHAMGPSGLSYARRPSGTNNRSTVPHLIGRSSSGSSSGLVRGFPRSAPIHSLSSTDDDDNFYDIGFSPGDALDTDESDRHSEKDWGDAKPKYQAIKTAKRARNRASLPACFSLLQMASPSKEVRSSPVSSSSGNTIARPSPPTPKLALSNGLSQVHIAPSFALPSAHVTPRGRRREADKSQSSRRSGCSSGSRSRSRSRRVVTAGSPHLIERSFNSRTEVKGSVKQVLDWSSVPGLPPRGRAALRRNSSPLPKMLMGVEDASHDTSAVTNEQEADRSESSSRSRPRTRGRARVDELGGVGSFTEAPGYGYGRSGLLNREKNPT